MMNLRVDATLLTGQKLLHKGIVCWTKYYSRYMDDFVAVARTREELLNMLDGFRTIAKEYGIIINERKREL